MQLYGIIIYYSGMAFVYIILIYTNTMPKGVKGQTFKTQISMEHRYMTFLIGYLCSLAAISCINSSGTSCTCLCISFSISPIDKNGTTGVLLLLQAGCASSSESTSLSLVLPYFFFVALVLTSLPCVPAPPPPFPIKNRQMLS